MSPNLLERPFLLLFFLICMCNMIVQIDSAVFGTPPSPRFHSRFAMTPSGRLYLFGGSDGTNVLNDLFELDPMGLSWTEVMVEGYKPSPRSKFAFVSTSDGKLILFGGNGTEGALNDVNSYDFASLLWSSESCTGTPPSPRDSVAATVASTGSIFIFGGVTYLGGMGYESAELWELNLNSGCQWTLQYPGGTPPYARRFAGLTAAADALYLTGGAYSQSAMNDLYELNLTTMTWSALSVVGGPPAMDGMGFGAGPDGGLYYYGGWENGYVDGAQWGYRTSIYRYDIAAGTWRRLSPRGVPLPPRGHFAFAVSPQGLIYVFGGELQDADWSKIDDLWMADIHNLYWSRCDGPNAMDCCPPGYYAGGENSTCHHCASGPGCAVDPATCCTDAYNSRHIPPHNSSGPCDQAPPTWQAIVSGDEVTSWSGGLGLLNASDIYVWACVNRTGQLRDRRCPGMAHDGLACYIYREATHPAGPGFVYWGRDSRLKLAVPRPTPS